MFLHRGHKIDEFGKYRQVINDILRDRVSAADLLESSICDPRFKRHFGAESHAIQTCLFLLKRTTNKFPY